MEIKVTHTIKNNAVKILIDGVLHIYFSRSELLGIQSWKMGKDYFAVEITLQGGSILCEYDSREKWLAILTALTDILP